jgi:hypothetical protein
MLPATNASPQPKPYRPRKPQTTAFYQCVEDHFESLEQVYDERFARQYGFFRPYVRNVIYRFLDCGVLHNGFARVRCDSCGHEYLLAFSCKRRHFCPSCHQKRVVEFGQWLLEEVVKAVPHRHWVFSIPKMLRRSFLYDRKLLCALSRCAWESLKQYLQEVLPETDAQPGAVIAVQTFGGLLEFNPHCHILLADGGFYGRDMFRVAPRPETKPIEELFRHKVFRLLLRRKKVRPELIDNLMGWRHSGFHVYAGPRILPRHAESMENLARYIIRASFAQERMTYFSREARVTYTSRDKKRTRTFDALEWLAAMCSHVPNKGEQMVRYYGYYSNVCRGKRKAKGEDEALPTVLRPDEGSSAPSRKEWARMIQKIYEVDPLTCPKCSGAMRILAFIEDQEVIRKILSHLGLWKRTPRAPPPPPPPDVILDSSLSQLPAWEDDLNQDPGFPIDWSA